MTIYEMKISDITPGPVQSEFQMMDNTSSLPACLDGVTQPAPISDAGTTTDSGAFRVLQGEKKNSYTLTRSSTETN